LRTVGDAREQIILRRETHLDQLTAMLQERVRRVVEPLLRGDQAEPNRSPLTTSSSSAAAP
jgi:hypothetical protein